MADKTNDIEDKMLRYMSPNVSVNTVNIQCIICLSGDYSTSTDPEEDQLP